MRRREFIAGLGSVAVWPVVARAQQPAMPVVGVLSQERAGSYVPPEFRQGLSQAGYVEGRNVAFDYHWAGDQYDQLPALAADLVHRHVGVIFANGLPASEAAKAATSIIPVVFRTGANPVQLGLVSGLNRPGGNVTGVTNLAGELNTKRLELLHEAFPTAKVIAVLVNPTEPNAVNLARNFEAAAHKLGLEHHTLHASTERDFDMVITTLRDRRAGGLVISPDVFLGSQNARSAALLLQAGVPAISAAPGFALAGGLMSYSSENMYRAAGLYVGRILKGEKPGDLPVVQPTKFEFVINLRTAKALGLIIPETLLATADEVIQ